MALHLHTSNRLEALVEQLAEVLAREPLSALEPQQVVVQSQGMQRWVQLQLARRHGICANVRFPFPNALAHDLFHLVLGEGSDDPAFAREVMVWRILKALPSLLGRPEFARVRGFIGSRTDSRRLYQVAARVAYLFDQYLLYRPQWMLAWPTDHPAEDAGWQGTLWQTIVADEPAQHFAALRQRFHQALQAPSAPIAARPKHLAVFGVSALPPFHVELLTALERWAEVHLFLLQPSDHYWGELTSKGEAQRLRRRAHRDGETTDDHHFEEGHGLLAALGQLGRDFLKVLLDAGDWDITGHFDESGHDSLLHTLQSDIRHLRNRGVDETPRALVAADDDSIQIHSCHSPLREMEVLSDHLLDWFARDAALRPNDVLVMVPDIDAYAPFVQAVFDVPEGERLRIPYNLADRSPRRESNVIGTFLALLQLTQARLAASEVLALLEHPLVRGRFGLSEGDLVLVQRWIRETNIRWGLDDAHRHRLGLAEVRANTWRAGLDQLWLGYSMLGQRGTSFAGILPYADLEGEAAEVLGRFSEFLDQLEQTLEQLRQPHRPFEWAHLLQSVLNTFFLEDGAAEAELRTLRQALASLLQQQERAQLDAPLDLPLVVEHLAVALAEPGFGSGFLTGGVTFCALKPMRSIPFKVICLLGLDDGVFPRPVTRLGFDLMQHQPRLGDRSARADDRYLFLETVLSARARLYLSYVGQSIRDNSAKPPSVLVTQLIDCLARGFNFPDGQTAEEYLVTRHRLQAFHPDYFAGGDRWFSYSEHQRDACERSRQARTAPAARWTPPLPEPEPEWRQVELASLAAFFCNPAKFLLQRRLGLRLPEKAREIEDGEPFTLEALERYRLGEELLDELLDGGTPAEVLQGWRAGGQLPWGEAGAAHFRDALHQLQPLHQRLLDSGYRKTLDPLAVELSLGSFRLTGRLVRRSAAGLIHFRAAKIRSKDVLRLWIEHLALSASMAGQSVTSLLAGIDEWRRIGPVTDPTAVLERLLGLYWTGLSRPLKFFPEASWAFAAASRNSLSGGRRNPFKAAQAAWEGNEFQEREPEGEDPWFALCFATPSPLDEEFAELARTVFDPVLAHQQVES